MEENDQEPTLRDDDWEAHVVERHLAGRAHAVTVGGRHPSEHAGDSASGAAATAAADRVIVKLIRHLGCIQCCRRKTQ